VRAALLMLAVLLSRCTTRTLADLDDDADDPVVEGPEGERGGPGPRGERGPVGPPGATWRPVTYVVQDFVYFEPGDCAEAFATCEPGDFVIHGGCRRAVS